MRMISDRRWAGRTLWISAILWAMAVPGSAQSVDDFFKGDVIHDLYLTIFPDDWKRLKDNFLDDTYYPGDIEWGEAYFENIGVRSRGLGSRTDLKPGLKVDCDRYEDGQRCLGLRSFHLKNMIQDASMLKERVAMLFFQRMGFPVPREAYARLYINDEFAGLYIIVESIDKVYLKKNFDENDGHLYSYEYAGPYYYEWRGPEASKYVPSPFKPKTREKLKDQNAEPLVALIRLFNEAPVESFDTALADHIDIRSLLTEVAVENFLAEFDGILGEFGTANFYIYRFEKKNFFRYLPWDKDNTFNAVERSIWKNTNDYVFMRRALENPSLRMAYLEALAKAIEQAGGPGGWLEETLNTQYNLIRQSVLDDPLKLCPPLPFRPIERCTNEQFEAEVERMRNFIRERALWMRPELESAGYVFPQ